MGCCDSKNADSDLTGTSSLENKGRKADLKSRKEGALVSILKKDRSASASGGVEE